MIASLPASEARVIIAIVSTNEVDNLINCLSCLAASTHPSFHVMICENGGVEGFGRTTTTLGETEFVKRLPAQPAGEPPLSWTSASAEFTFGADQRRVTVLRAPRNLGYAGGVNACIAAAAKHPWDAIWVLNPDTFPEPDALAALVRRQKEGAYGIVGSRLISASNGTVQTWGGFEWRSVLGRGRMLGRGQPATAIPDVADVERRTDVVSGASMYVSRAYIETVGVMDEDFFVYDEEVEWALRRGSFKLGYAHDSTIRHIAGATTGARTDLAQRSRFSIYLYERNRVLLARKRFGARWGILAAIALAQTFEELVRVRSLRCFRIALDGWWAGVRGETGAPSFMQEKSDISGVFSTVPVGRRGNRRAKQA
jgi:N-acetylglucosaminyl-diphospho-decaprenol L-rhamnosyltransferase